MSKTVKKSLLSLSLALILVQGSIKPANDSKAPSSKSTQKIALLDSLNPELSSLSEKEKKQIVGDGIRFAQTVIWRPSTIEASVSKISGIKASLDARLKDFANTPQKKGEKSEAEMLNESRTLGHVLTLIKNHQEGKLDLDTLQQQLGIRQRISKSKKTKELQKQAVKSSSKV